MALVGAGAALDADVHVDFERAVLAEQVAELLHARFLPVGQALAGEVQGLHVLLFSRDRLQVTHGPRGHRRGHDIVANLGHKGIVSHLQVSSFH
ncbi:hypothetical protein MAIT1_00948 [Magnetofaba australis IT-1]|uniref:Uncharacterized protein n=1 Tax=Magnetofaba australis IT-1 TaxID=1434232 RepID=A0A1Y2JZS0_9PROT|nr:hypothetical protein MAIT1_00948 [Magnetofaba australis IT-1]